MLNDAWVEMPHLVRSNAQRTPDALSGHSSKEDQRVWIHISGARRGSAKLSMSRENPGISKD
jgi:hypothetical protein